MLQAMHPVRWLIFAATAAVLFACSSENRKSEAPAATPKIRKMDSGAAEGRRPAGAVPISRSPAATRATTKASPKAGAKARSSFEADSTTASVWFGTVTHEGGAPASGAKIELQAMDRTAFDLSAANRQVLAETTCTQSGEYELMTTQTGMVILRASAPGAAAVLAMSRKQAQTNGQTSFGRTRIDLTLPKAAQVSGKVVDEGGKPVPGVSVSARILDMTRRFKPEDDVYIFPQSDPTTSTADGAFVLTDLVSGECEVAGVLQGFVPACATVSAPAQGVTLLLGSGGATIEGRVVMAQSNAAVTSAAVQLSMRSSGSMRPSAFPPFKTLSDENGYFRVEHLPAGSYSAYARKEKLQLVSSAGVGNKAEMIEVAANETTSGVTLRLYAGHTCTGKVLERGSSKPIAGVLIRQAWGSEPLPSATSGPDGTYYLTGLFGGNTALSLEKKSYKAVTDRNSGPYVQLPLPPSKLEITRDFEMVPAVTITGIVRLEAGKRMPGVPVELLGMYGPQQQSNTTDGNGEYSFEVAPYSSQRVQAKPADYPIALSELLQVEDKPLTATDIILKPGGIVSGTVVNPSNTPVEGAEVTIYAPTAGGGGMVYHVQIGKPVSDSAGRFTQDRIPQGAIAMYAQKKGFADSERREMSLSGPETKSDIVLMLRPGQSISGKITSADGKPVAGAYVHCWSSGSGSSSKNAQSQKDGTYTLEDLVAGLYTVSVSAQREQEQREGVKAGSTNVDFVLGKPKTPAADTAEFIGKVLDYKTKAPLSDFTVEVKDNNEAVAEKDSAQAGRFRLKGLRVRNWFRLRITAPGCMDIETESLSISPASKPEEKEFLMGPGGSIGGRVIDGATQKPMAEVRVLLRGSGSEWELREKQPQQTVTTDASGEFKVEGLAKGTWEVYLTPRVAFPGGGTGYAMSQRMGTVEMDSGEVVKTYELPTARVEGKVVDSSGNAVANAAVKMRTPLGMSYYMTDRAAGADGTFAYDDMPAGEYSFSVNHSELGRASVKVTLKDNDTQKIELRLEKKPGGTLISTVLNMEGQPLQAAWCYLEGANGRYEHGMSRGPDGVMKIPDIPEGTYKVEVSYWSYSDAQHTVDIKIGETAKIDDVLYPAGALRWTLQDKSGTPLPNVPCTLTPADPNSIERVRTGTTDSSGTWVVRGMGAGQYDAKATLPNGKTLSARLAIAAGQPTNQTTKAE